MKPEQLNRLIRANGRMQPWFLRNTSELYESAVRTYYERGASSAMAHSTHSRNMRSLRSEEENAGPLRKVRRAAQECSPVRLQADQAASITSGQLLHTVMQASRRRSMSFSVGGAEMDSGRPSSGPQPYSVFGQSALDDSCSSSSVPSQDGILMDKLPRCLRRNRATPTAASRRERRRMGRRSSRESEVGNGHQLAMDMGLISARSLSLPPLSGLDMGSSYMRQIPPSRQHHMKAIEKTSLANAALIPRREPDPLITVDESLKRRISVVDQAVNKQGTSAELGHLMAGGNAGGGASGARLPSRVRFHTLGDRVKQFEYIQFADGPVTSYAFDRRPQAGAPRRVSAASSRSSSFSRVEDPVHLRRQEQDTQTQTKRPLSFHNVLHANHRQRSRSLETSRGSLLESLGSLAPPLATAEQGHAPPHSSLGIARSTRGFCLYNSSRSSISDWGKSSASVANWGETSVANFGFSQPTLATKAKGTPAMKLTPRRGGTPGDKSLRAESAQSSVTCQPNSNSKTAPASSLPIKNETISAPTVAANSKPLTRDSRKLTLTPKLSSNSGAYNDPTWGTSKDTNSTAKSESRRSSNYALVKVASKSNLEAASGAFSKDSNPYPAHFERRVPLQQRGPQSDSPDEEMSLCLTKVKSKVKVKPKKKPLEKAKAKPRVSKVTSNQVSRSSHRAFFQPPHDDMPAGHPPKKVHRKQQALLEKAEKSPEQWEKNLDKRKREHGSRASAGPSSHLKGSNHLLVASASQVTAYKRAFRTQQQMLKAEILHQQARHLQKFKPKPKPNPNPSSESSPHSSQQPPAEDVRPIQLPRLQSRRGPIPTTSRAPIRPKSVVNSTGRSGAFSTEEGAAPMVGLGKGAKGAKGTTGSPVKAVAAPVTAPLTAARKRTTATSTADPAFRQKTKPIRAAYATATTSAKGAVAGAATATSAAAKSKSKVEGEGRRGGVRSGAEGPTTKRRLALTQQQNSRQDNGSGNGSSLLGFRRETANRAASSLLQRRDESEQTSQAQSPSQLRSAQRQQQRQQQQPQRRHFHFQYPPWRPSY